MSEQHTPRVAILGSPDPEGGETAEAVARALRDNEHKLLDFQIALVVATQPEAGILERADRWSREWGWQVETATASLYDSSRKPSDRIMELAEDHDIDLVVSLGFKTILTGRFVDEYGYSPEKDCSVYDARAINLHPGTVPLTATAIGEAASSLELDAHRRGELGIGQVVMHAITEQTDDARAVFDGRYVPILARDTAQSLHARKRRIEQAAAPYMINKFLERQRRDGLL